MTVIAMMFAFAAGVFLREIIEFIGRVKKPKPQRCFDVASIEKFGTDWIIRMTDGTEYCGYSTVWHYYPSGKRCATSVESRLSDILTAHGWAERVAKREAARS